MDFFIILTTPENMKTVCATLKSQCSIVIFAKIAKNWPNFSFLAIILVPDQKNPNFLDFLDPYTCPDLGQEESQKVWSTLVITLVATLVPTVLKNQGLHSFSTKFCPIIIEIVSKIFSVLCKVTQ